MSDFEKGWNLWKAGKPIQYCKGGEQVAGWESARNSGKFLTAKEAELRHRRDVAPLREPELNYEDDGNVLFA